MTSHTVERIIDGDTFVVSPAKCFNGRSFTKIRPEGYDARELGSYGGQADKDALSKLILNKTVHLEAIKQSYDRLLCKVLVNGRSLSNLMR